MIRWEVIILFGLMFVDIMFTYNLLHEVKKKGVKDWWKYEFNPIVKKYIKRFGLHKGIRISALWGASLLTIVLLYLFYRVPANDFTSMVFFTMGFYTLMNIIHITSWTAIKNETKNKKGKAKNR